jgi:hypothetical protein
MAHTRSSNSNTEQMTQTGGASAPPGRSTAASKVRLAVKKGGPPIKTKTIPAQTLPIKTNTMPAEMKTVLAEMSAGKMAVKPAGGAKGTTAAAEELIGHGAGDEQTLKKCVINNILFLFY